MTFDLAEVVRIAKHEREEDIASMISEVMLEDTHAMSYEGRVQVKERPRLSKGRTFTPEKTRKFEASVQKWAKDRWDRKPLIYPIRLELIVFEECLVPETVLHSLWGLTFNQKGDVDNLGKSVLDGMNGVVYKDDKQIVDLRIKRCYARTHGFDVMVQRAGLTPLEYRNFKARMK